MNIVVCSFFFFLINCGTILETHIQWREVCITKTFIATEKRKEPRWNFYELLPKCLKKVFHKSYLNLTISFCNINFQTICFSRKAIVKFEQLKLQDMLSFPLLVQWNHEVTHFKITQRLLMGCFGDSQETILEKYEHGKYNKIGACLL